MSDRYDRELKQNTELVARILAAVPAVPAAAPVVIRTDTPSVDLAIGKELELAVLGIEARIELIK